MFFKKYSEARKERKIAQAKAVGFNWAVDAHLNEHLSIEEIERIYTSAINNTTDYLGQAFDQGAKEACDFIEELDAATN